MSDSTKHKTYNRMIVTDPNEAVWVSPVDSYEAHLKYSETRDRGKYEDYIILTGPTGSGKSSFIEAIASKSTKDPLGIAKDQLESVTQEARIYEIKNLKDYHGDTIYIIDTPGFADPRISELQVLDKVAYWRDQSLIRNHGYVRLLYFHPITDIRLPASRKQCLDMVKRCWGSRLCEQAMLVTSMWDRIPERSRETIEDRFTQISTNHWGDWVTEESPSVKFDNTFDSAMEILDILCGGKGEYTEFPVISGLGMEGTTDNPVYEALMGRLSSLEQKQQSLTEDLALPSNQGQTELINLLTKDLAETERLLEQFTTNMDDLLKRLSPPQSSGKITNPKPANVADPVTDMRHISSLSKRFGRWVHKKVEKLHFSGLSRKGA